mmetsp:Transcript_29687/g.78754  ORF Transcript_29687/g.78754 Transcript_29687/m.78754 type:complete len:119 (-) Transcript_29687:143-499(-)
MLWEQFASSSTWTVALNLVDIWWIHLTWLLSHTIWMAFSRPNGDPVLQLAVTPPHVVIALPSLIMALRGSDIQVVLQSEFLHTLVGLCLFVRMVGFVWLSIQPPCSEVATVQAGRSKL